MQVKVFEAQNMASGLKKVKETLGPDALILSTKTIRKGKLGVLGKPVLEITAAIDQPTAENSSNPLDTKTEHLASQKPHDPFKLKDNGNEAINYEEIWQENQETITTPQPVSGYITEHENQKSLKDELSEIRNIIKGLNNKINVMHAGYPGVQHPYIEPDFFYRQTKGETDQGTVDLLLQRGINIRTAAAVIGNLKAHGEQAKGSENPLQDAIAHMLRVTNPLNREEKDTQQKRLALIGATGVGKTTTIAKIAAGNLQQKHNRVALITIDTYRIAAIEQLKVYGEIMQMPVEVVIEPAHLEKALERHSDCDLVLIDTAGRSPRNKVELEELADFLKPHLSIDNHLVLDATTREEELAATIHRFSLLPIDSIIFSKLDECERVGTLLNIHMENSIPISFLANGQRVPEDLIFPDPSTVAGLILNQDVVDETTEESEV
jgi:flagellar biosynthesis protein FlhF